MEVLDTDTRFAPMSPLSIVSDLHFGQQSCRFDMLGIPSYRIVLPVRRRIHCGIGRFCFAALASFFLVRNDLWL